MSIILDGTDAEHIQIRNVLVENNSITLGDHSIVVGNRGEVLNCEVEGGDFGIAAIDSVNDWQTGSTLIQGNRVRNARTSVYSELWDTNVSDNDLFLTGAYEYSVFINGGSRAVVSDNIIYNLNGDDAIYLKDVDKFTVTGNIDGYNPGGG